MSRYDIYIIYHRADIETARKCVQLLKAQGYSCFVDFDSLQNDSFEEQVFEAINGSKCILLIYSKNTESSQYVRREVEFALEHGIQIIPMLLSGIDSASWYFGKLTAPIYGPIEVREKQLIQHVKAIVGDPSVSVASESYDYCPCPSPSKRTTNNRRFHYTSIIFLCLCIVVGVTISRLFHQPFLWTSAKPEKEDFEQYKQSEIDSIINILDSITESFIKEQELGNLVSPGFGYSHEKDTVSDETTRESLDTNIVFKGEPSRDNEQCLSPPSFSDNHSENNHLCDYLLVIFAIFLLPVLGWAFFSLRRRSKRENIKLTCNKSAIVHLDGVTINEIEAHQVHKIHLSKGNYIVDFELKSDKTKHYTISVNVKNTRDDQIIEGKFNLLLSEKNTIKVFIAGSTRLIAERDALRSAIGLMYNKYKEDNLLIEAYSFDDFPREYTEGGHQKLYDDFIKKEADWVVFITDGTIGDKTIWELNNAIGVHKSNKRPKILMYSKPESENPSSQMDSFRKLLNEENQYWIDYTSLNDIKSTFKEHLQWDLYNLMKNQYTA